MNILPSDDTSVLAAMFLHFLPRRETTTASPMMSILRLMVSSGTAARGFPLYADQRSGLSKLTSWLMASSSGLQEWLIGVQAHITATTDLQWPVVRPPRPAAHLPRLQYSVALPISPDSLQSRRSLVPAIENFSRSSRVLTPLALAGMSRNALAPLCSSLLQPLRLERFVKYVSESKERLPSPGVVWCSL